MLTKLTKVPTKEQIPAAIAPIMHQLELITPILFMFLIQSALMKKYQKEGCNMNVITQNLHISKHNHTFKMEDKFPKLLHHHFKGISQHKKICIINLKLACSWQKMLIDLMTDLFD